ncbi:MAG: ATP synthase F1 subunit epsilon [Opitutales bacterium]
MPLLLEIVTPEDRVFSDTIDDVVLPTTTGEIGILPGHIPLLTQLEAGELRVARSGKVDFLAVGRGFAQVEQGRVSVLAESAIKLEEIDVTAVEKAMKSAQDALTAKEEMDPAEVERLESAVRFAMAQLLIKKKKR